MLALRCQRGHDVAFSPRCMPALQTGNILVDSPRFNPILAKRIEELGGVRHIFLTHKDDVGDHEVRKRLVLERSRVAAKRNGMCSY